MLKQEPLKNTAAQELLNSLGVLSRLSVNVDARETIQRKTVFKIEDFIEFQEPLETKEFSTDMSDYSPPSQYFSEAKNRESIYINVLEQSNFTFRPVARNYASQILNDSYLVKKEDKSSQTCDDYGDSVCLDSMSDMESMKQEIQFWKKSFNDQVKHNLKLNQKNKILQKENEELIQQMDFY